MREEINALTREKRQAKAIVDTFSSFVVDSTSVTRWWKVPLRLPLRTVALRTSADETERQQPCAAPTGV